MSKPDLNSYLPFISKGHVSVVGSDGKVPVTILRDTGVFDSFILASALPFSEETDTGSFIPVLGMGMPVFHVPVHKLVLHSGLFEGEVKMGVCPALPVDGVTLILGNDVAGGRVWADQRAQPVVVPVPLGSNGPDENEKQFPKVFKACAVTRAMNMASHGADSLEYATAGDGATELFVLSLSNTPLSVSHSELVSEQRADPTLKELFQFVLPGDGEKPCTGTLHSKRGTVKEVGAKWRGFRWTAYLSDCCALQISRSLMMSRGTWVLVKHTIVF